MAEAGPNADRRFVDYYAQQSQSPSTLARFAGIKDAVLSLRSKLGATTHSLAVADIGCGAGSQSLMWAAEGHRVAGVDISDPLIQVARQRAAAQSFDVEFAVGSATQLPFPDASFDVVLTAELLEHLPDWKPCVDEVVRVLKPGGIAYFCTTNRLCPVQQEFDLPLYSWYPSAIKHRCEQMAVTTHGHWVQFTSFPAVHWFSFHQLSRYLNERGVTAFDRFDVLSSNGSPLRRAVVSALKGSRALRFIGQLCTPYTVAFGVKRSGGDAPAAIAHP
jgi:2-polyprenyl-6-hydroxyphenyl methylase/3-demethylubiquinone-9 3-methyltransferase